MSQPVTNGSQWCILPIEYRGQTSRCISAKTTGGMLAPALLRPQQRRFAGTRSLGGIGRLAALILTVLRAWPKSLRPPNHRQPPSLSKGSYRILICPSAFGGGRDGHRWGAPENQVRSGLSAGGRWIRTSGSPTDPLPFSRKQSRLLWRFDGLATRNRKFEPCCALAERLALAL